ncbi:MAG: hypothetical protein D6734_09755 [Candidatus Schekmanbacteria bacterium]|nr:MAG: hypothetical protein D6734_09755 [Candidatus Schekmanbacteria bacterium]
MLNRKNIYLIFALILSFSLLPYLSFAKSFSLNLKSAYDFRSARFKDIRTNDVDHDFFQYITFKSEGYGLENLETYANGRIERDIDGTGIKDYFRDVRDTYSGDDRISDIYSIWANFKNVLGIFDSKIGRQYFYGAELAHFDGASIDFNKSNLFNLSLFGGRRVSLRYHPRKKGIWGGNFDLTINEKTLFEARFVKYLDFSYDFAFHQNVTRNLDLSLKYALINNDPRNVSAEFDYFFPKLSSNIKISYFRLLGGSNADDYDFDYTSSSNRGKEGYDVARLNIGDLDPYEELSILWNQPLFKKFALEASLTIHDLLNNNEGDQYNSDFLEFTAGLNCRDIMLEGNDIFVEWRHYKDERSSKRFETESNEVRGQYSQMLGNNISVSAGTFYRFYDYNRNVYQTYGFSTEIRGEVTKRISYLVAYSYEEDDELAVPFSKLDYLQGVRVELEFNF